MKYSFICAEKAVWPVLVMCRALGVSRSGFYSAQKRPESKRAYEDRRLTVLARAAHAESGGCYGSPRIHEALKDSGEKLSRKRVVRLMQQSGLVGKAPRKFVCTTDSKHHLSPAENVLAQDFSAAKPNQRWVGDVTFLKTPAGWLYLAVIVDLYSRYVVGWATSAVNDTQLVRRALDMAVQHRKPYAGLLFHSDRGSTYASSGYQATLKSYGMRCSMSRRGNCYDNAVVESFFRTLKTELAEEFESHSDGKRKLFEYIEGFYNTRRKHSSLGYRSPAQFETEFLNPTVL